MKLLACDKCHAVVQLVQKRIKRCKCGNIKGKYLDKRNIEVWVQDKNSSRILGLQNQVRYGWIKEGKVWIIPFDNETVTIRRQEKLPDWFLWEDGNETKKNRQRSFWFLKIT